MKRIMTGFALTVLIATSAMAQQVNRSTPHRNTQQTLSGPYVANGEVILDGRVIGKDPDLNIRSEMLREYPSRNGE